MECWPIAWSFGAAENCDSVKWIFGFGQRESSPNASGRKEKFRPVQTGQYSGEAPPISPFQKTRSLPLAVLTRRSSAQDEKFLATTNGQRRMTDSQGES
jgi:hypothetical protein